MIVFGGIELGGLIAGLGAGILYAVTGYFKSLDEPFDLVKFLTAVIAGGIAGVYAAWTGTPDLAVTFAAAMAYSVPIGNVLKAIWQKVKEWLEKK